MSHTTHPAPTPRPLEDGLAARIHTPALLLDLAACRRNLGSVMARIERSRSGAAADAWRPHVKTAKVPEVLALFGALGVTRFKCATTREAEVLLEAIDAGGLDILLAHHLYGPALRRYADFAERHPAALCSTLVESVEQITAAPDRLGLFIDVDLGMGRTGLHVDQHAAIEAVAAAAGDRLRGLHAYDGHHLAADSAERERGAHAGYDRLVSLCDRLVSRGLAVEEVITAGTPAFPAALSYKGLSERAGTTHRISPGTVVYHDLRSTQQLPDLNGEFAATVLTRVASRSESHYTVDAGSKAVEASGVDCIARSLERPRDVALRQSEEHTVFRSSQGPPPPRGALLRLVPGHVCPTVNLAREAVLLEDGRFAGVAKVSAGAHEVVVEEE